MTIGECEISHYQMLDQGRPKLIQKRFPLSHLINVLYDYTGHLHSTKCWVVSTHVKYGRCNKNAI